MVTDALRQVLTGRAVTTVRYADLEYESEHPPHWRRRCPRTISQIETFWRPERRPKDGGPSSTLSLGGLVLRDFDRDRRAVVVIDEHRDVRIYFSPSRARRDGYFTNNYVSL